MKRHTPKKATTKPKSAVLAGNLALGRHTVKSNLSLHYLMTCFLKLFSCQPASMRRFVPLLDTASPKFPRMHGGLEKFGRHKLSATAWSPKSLRPAQKVHFPEVIQKLYPTEPPLQSDHQRIAIGYWAKGRWVARFRRRRAWALRNLKKLLDNARVVRYLSRYRHEFLSEFQKIAKTKSLTTGG